MQCTFAQVFRYFEQIHQFSLKSTSILGIWTNFSCGKPQLRIGHVPWCRGGNTRGRRCSHVPTPSNSKTKTLYGCWVPISTLSLSSDYTGGAAVENRNIVMKTKTNVSSNVIVLRIHVPHFIGSFYELFLKIRLTIRHLCDFGVSQQLFRKHCLGAST